MPEPIVTPKDFENLTARVEPTVYTENGGIAVGGRMHIEFPNVYKDVPEDQRYVKRDKIGAVINALMERNMGQVKVFYDEKENGALEVTVLPLGRDTIYTDTTLKSFADEINQDRKITINQAEIDSVPNTIPKEERWLGLENLRVPNVEDAPLSVEELDVGLQNILEGLREVQLDPESLQKVSAKSDVYKRLNDIAVVTEAKLDVVIEGVFNETQSAKERDVIAVKLQTVLEDMLQDKITTGSIGQQVLQDVENKLKNRTGPTITSESYKQGNDLEVIVKLSNIQDSQGRHVIALAKELNEGHSIPLTREQLDEIASTPASRLEEMAEKKSIAVRDVITKLGRVLSNDGGFINELGKEMAQYELAHTYRHDPEASRESAIKLEDMIRNVPDDQLLRSFSFYPKLAEELKKVFVQQQGQELREMTPDNFIPPLMFSLPENSLKQEDTELHSYSETLDRIQKIQDKAKPRKVITEKEI